MSTCLLWTTKNIVAFLAEATITGYFPSVTLGANSCAHGRGQPSRHRFLPNHVFSDNRSSIVWEQCPFQQRCTPSFSPSLVRGKMALKACELLQFCCCNMNLWPSWHAYPSQREGSLLCSSPRFLLFPCSGFFLTLHSNLVYANKIWLIDMHACICVK